MWNTHDCSNDSDCTKYTEKSLKYTDGDIIECPGAKSWRDPNWRADACKCKEVTGNQDYSRCINKFHII